MVPMKCKPYDTKFWCVYWYKWVGIFRTSCNTSWLRMYEPELWAQQGDALIVVAVDFAMMDS